MNKDRPEPDLIPDPILTNLTVNGWPVSGFDPAVPKYTVISSDAATSVRIDATANHGKVKIVGTGEHPLIPGNNSFVIACIIEGNSGNVKIKHYGVNIVVAKPDVDNFPNDIESSPTAITQQVAKPVVTLYRESGLSVAIETGSDLIREVEVFDLNGKTIVR